MMETTCCVFGHRDIEETPALVAQVRAAVKRLVAEQGVVTFLFGSKSRFDDLCHRVVTEYRAQYPHIRRVYVRAAFPHINEAYRQYLSEKYEDSYYPESIAGAGRAVYVERNYEMVKRSQFCMVYCDYAYTPITRRSGTKTALAYAQKQGRVILRFP